MTSACAHCKKRGAAKKLTCAACGRTSYCSVRCQTMDFEVGFHAAACLRPILFGAPTDMDTSAVPTLFDGSAWEDRRPLAYQAPPHVTAFGLDTHPYVAALSMPTASPDVFQWQLSLEAQDGDDALLHGAQAYGHDLLVVPRIEDGVYVLLGEDDDFERVHDSVPPRRFVGGRRWMAVPEDALVAYSRALGRVLGRLHFRLGLDGCGFSVVGGHERFETRPRLYVQCDARQVRHVNVREANVDTIDRLSFVLGRLAYVPNPRQAALFAAFATGYTESAPTEETRRMAGSVLERMSVYLE